MCHRCEGKSREDKAIARQQVREMLDSMDPDAELLLFTASVNEETAEKGSAICGLAGAMTGVGMAALLAEIHTQIEGDPNTMDLALKFMAMRKEQLEAAAEKAPLDLSELIRATPTIQ